MLTHQIDQSENYVHNAGKSSHIRQLLHGRNEAARFVGSVRVLTELVEEERFQIVIHIDVARHLMGSVSHISHFLVLHKALGRFDSDKRHQDGCSSSPTPNHPDRIRYLIERANDSAIVGNKVLHKLIMTLKNNLTKVNC